MAEGVHLASPEAINALLRWIDPNNGISFLRILTNFVLEIYFGSCEHPALVRSETEKQS